MSEFGKGVVYPLGLFLAHASELRSTIQTYEEMYPGRGEDRGASLWMYSASDHIFDFMPESAPNHLRERCEAFRDEVLAKRLPMGDEPNATLKDCQRLIGEAKSLLLEIDLHHGVMAEEADWS